MNPTGSGRSDTYSQPAGVLGVSACGESSRFFVSHLNETKLVFVSAQGLKHSVDAVAGKSEDRVYSPVDEAFYHEVSNHVGHFISNHEVIVLANTSSGSV